MEKLIVSIVLIVGWIIIESVKKARSSREDLSHPHADGHAPKQTMPNPWKLLEEEGEHADKRSGHAHSHHAAAVPHERKPVAQKKTRMKATLPEEGGSVLKKTRHVAAAATQVQPSAIGAMQPGAPDAFAAMEPGSFDTMEPNAFSAAQPEADTDRTPTLTPEEQARRKAHFERWRRAIIDSQVLQPKF